MCMLPSMTIHIQLRGKSDNFGDQQRHMMNWCVETDEKFFAMDELSSSYTLTSKNWGWLLPILQTLCEMKRLFFSNTKNEALFGCLAVLFIYVQKTSTCLIRPKGFFHLHFWVVFVNIGLKNDVLIFVLVLWYKTKKAKKSMYFSCCCH